MKKTTDKKNWVIKANGGYFDGLQAGLPISKAKRFTRTEARVVNRVVMCGNGKVVQDSQPVE